MSLPILKALYFRTRLFFCQLMKISFCISVLTLFATNVFTQLAHEVPSRIDYINTDFTQSVSSPKRYGIGFKLVNNQYERLRFPLSSIVEFDSNSYSRVVFNIGSIATQNIGLALGRPVSKTGKLDLVVYRVSNPGWVSRSFYRRTNIELGYKQKISERFNWETSAGLDLLDREQSGGVKDSIKYDLFERGESELNLEGNIWLTNAYNRRNDLFAITHLDYALISLNNVKLHSGLKLGGVYEKFSFVDNNSDSAYYSHFSSEIVDVFSDSFSIGQFRITPNLVFEFEQIDSNRIQLELGLNQSWFRIRNNAHESLPYNQELYGNVLLERPRIKFSAQAEIYPSGYSRGDSRIDSKLMYFIIKKDSSTNYLAFEARYGYSSGRVARIFEDYQSKIKSIKNGLRKEQFLEFGGGMNLEFENFSALVDLDYLKIGNLAYFNERAEVMQKRLPVEVYSAQLTLKYSNSFLELTTIGRYQWNDRSKYYSLPEWTSINKGSIYWDMFKKRLRMKGGLQSRFFSEYYNRGYLPFFDVEYVQSFHRFDDYFQLDAFVETNIKSVSVGIVAYNLLYGLIDTNPIVAPNMPSIPRYFSLRFDWNFKN
jgi:hypothetical protein